VAENHPDKLVARGVPAEFVELATKKLAAINAAYEEIRLARRSMTAH
jgi:DnaJ like chaperone protein